MRTRTRWGRNGPFVPMVKPLSTMSRSTPSIRSTPRVRPGSRQSSPADCQAGAASRPLYKRTGSLHGEHPPYLGGVEGCGGDHAANGGTRKVR